MTTPTLEQVLADDDASAWTVRAAAYQASRHRINSRVLANSGTEYFCTCGAVMNGLAEHHDHYTFAALEALSVSGTIDARQRGVIQALWSNDFDSSWTELVDVVAGILADPVAPITRCAGRTG